MAPTGEAEFKWIDRESGFRELVHKLEKEDILALDTESDGFHHYFDKLCLLQISTRSEHFIVDILALDSLEPLGPVLQDSTIRKVLHAADQDLMYLARDHQLALRGLFDTSLAAMLLGYTRLGLASLLEEFFGLKLSKSNQRDDWSVRPLSPRQLAYAIADTNRLLDLAQALEQKLQAAGRLEWAAEEFEALEKKKWALPTSDPADPSRLKGWRDLNPAGQAILRELLLARDGEARRQDRPPFRVAGNTLLLALAAHPPQTVAAFRGIRGMPKHGGTSLAALFQAAIQRGLHDPTPPAAEGSHPPPRRSRSFRQDAGMEARRERLRRWRLKRAAEMGLAPGVVTPQRELDLLAAAAPASAADLDGIDSLRSWRRRTFGPEWLAVLAGK